MSRLPTDFRSREIWNLGCGNGQHAVWLKGRYPQTEVHGLDNNPEMLTRTQALSSGVEWRLGAVEVPKAPADLIFANACGQWLWGYEALLDRLVSHLSPDRVIAIQMPMAHETAHHRILRAVAAEGPWAQRLKPQSRSSALLSPETYYAVVSKECEAIDVWRPPTSMP